jgi:hypothetical protein
MRQLLSTLLAKIMIFAPKNVGVGAVFFMHKINISLLNKVTKDAMCLLPSHYIVVPADFPDSLKWFWQYHCIEKVGLNRSEKKGTD